MSSPSKKSKVPSKSGASDSSGNTSEDAPKKLKVVLEDNRSQVLIGLGIRTVIAALCLWKLGTIGQVLGILFAISAVFQGLRLARILRHRPGTFNVSSSEIHMPTGLCSGETLTLSDGQLQHAFFIRKTVPWTQAGPVLVVEADDKAYSFPRDWFASDSDQLRVARAMRRHL